MREAGRSPRFLQLLSASCPAQAHAHISSQKDLKPAEVAAFWAGEAKEGSREGHPRGTTRVEVELGFIRQQQR